MIIMFKDKTLIQNLTHWNAHNLRQQFKLERLIETNSLPII